MTCPGARPSTLGSGEPRRRLEARSGRLDGDDQARLLAEVRNHRDLVVVDDGDADHAALATPGKVTEPGRISRAKPGTSGSVSVPPCVSSTSSPLVRSSGSR